MPWVMVRMYFCEDCGRSFGKNPPTSLDGNLVPHHFGDHRMGMCKGRIVIMPGRPWNPEWTPEEPRDGR